MLSQLMVLFGFFALVLVSIFWINKAVRMFDKLIGDGQPAWVFFEFTALTLFGPLPGAASRLGEVRSSSRASAENTIGSILRNGRTVCGTLRPAENAFLFGKQADQIASAAVVPLADQIGILAVGSSDPNHYRSSLGTLFLSYIGEILERVLPRLLEKH